MSFRNFPVGMMAILAPSAPEFTGDPYIGIDSAAGPPAECEIRLDSNGNIEEVRLNFINASFGSWGSGLTMSDYDFRFDLTGGSANSPGSQAVNTWINGFNGMYWGCRENGVGVSTCNGTLRIRPAGGGADIDTALVNLQAETI